MTIYDGYLEKRHNKLILILKPNPKCVYHFLKSQTFQHFLKPPIKNQKSLSTAHN